jgi:TolA-binding protein
MSYKANSVIYFRGDASKKIYILQSGRMVLKREDIETGQEVQESIATGEFFGVKSALGKYVRDEDAIVVSDSNVVVFTVQEFEDLVSKNTRVGMKMLKVFSNQLRRIHSKVRTMLALDEQKNPEEGLFHNAEYYLKKKKYQESIHILRAFLKYYPNSSYAGNARDYLRMAEEYAQKYGSNNGPSIVNDEKAPDHSRGSGQAPKKAAPVKTADEKAYYDAVSIEGQGNFQQAMEMFAKLAAEQEGTEVGRKSHFEVGRCLFGMKQFDACIKHFGSMVKQFPEFPELADALFHVGQCYERLNDKAKAVSVYDRILQIPNLEDDMRRKVKQSQKAAGGN